MAPCVFEVRAELGNSSGDMGRERWPGLAHECRIRWPVSAFVTDMCDINSLGGAGGQVGGWAGGQPSWRLPTWNGILGDLHGSAPMGTDA